ncbi:MAG: hypothetical protein CBD02_05125, partial [Candidatus Pelagibacter sp. TMED142]
MGDNRKTGAKTGAVSGHGNTFKHASCLFVALIFLSTQAYAQSFDCSSIPFEATYNPDVAYAYDQQCGSQGVTLPALPIMPQFQPQQVTANVGYNEATGMMVVNGVQFHIDDHQAALASENALNGPAIQIPAGFRPMSQAEYHGYLNNIEHPIQASINRIKNYFRGKQRDYERMKRKIERAVNQCYAIA